MISKIQKQLKVFLLAILFVYAVYGAVDADIVNLPETKYTKTWYSGYLSFSMLNQDLQVHYMFYPSQRDIDNGNLSSPQDPLVLWLNGGPGCSSLIGASQENGPWVFKEDSTEIEINPHSWNLKASVLYLESPPGVGFSKTSALFPKWNDQTTAQVNLQSLVEFLKSYPEYRSREFYISGESYAGIYVPTLAQEVLEYNKQVQISEKINFKGFIIGNGCTHETECNLNLAIDPYLYETVKGQGFLDYQMVEEYNDKCGTSEQKNTQECHSVYNSQINTVMPGLNIYDLIGKCYHQTFVTPSDRSFGQNTWIKDIKNQYEILKKNDPNASQSQLDSLESKVKRIQRELSGNETVVNDVELGDCTDQIGPYTFYNQQHVKEALHIDTNIKWSDCSTVVGLFYKRGPTGTFPLYPSLIRQGLRIWVFSGDTDGAVPTAGTLMWVELLQKQQNYQTLEPWRAWYREGIQTGNRQNAGQFWQIEGLTMVTVKGVGHMVPQYARIAAQTMFEYFLEGSQLPAY